MSFNLLDEKKILFFDESYRADFNMDKWAKRIYDFEIIT
jgi:hypothetical protein